MRLGVVVAAGGRAERYGAGDKLAADLGGRTLLERTLAALPAHAAVVCVGPTVPTSRPVTWVREDPPHSGPLAAVAAGVPGLPREVTAVALVGGDMPAAGRLLPSLAYALAASGTGAPPASRPDPGPAQCALAVDPSGQRQPLLSVWRRDRLETRLAALAPVADQPVRVLLDGIVVREVPAPTSLTADVDTQDDLARLRAQEAAAPPPGAGSPDG